MPKEDAIEVMGKVVEKFKAGMFAIELDAGNPLTVGVPVGGVTVVVFVAVVNAVAGIDCTFPAPTATIL